MPAQRDSGEDLHGLTFAVLRDQAGVRWRQADLDSSHRRRRQFGGQVRVPAIEALGVWPRAHGKRVVREAMARLPGSRP